MVLLAREKGDLENNHMLEFNLTLSFPFMTLPLEPSKGVMLDIESC